MRTLHRDDAPQVLELDLTEPPATVPPADPLADPLTVIRTRRRPRLTDILIGLRRAATADEVAGIVIQVGGRGPGMALAQELRAAIAEFRRGGKPVFAWAETFGEFAPGNTGYAVAAGCDEVWVQESGDVGLTGIGTQPTFVRDALDRIGVTVQLGQRHEYKNAANMFTQQELTDGHRESLTRLVESLTDQLLTGISNDRGLPVERLRELLDTGPLSPTEAAAAGLVDHIGYRDEVYAAMRRKVGGRMRLGFLHRFKPGLVRAGAARISTRGGVIALVHGTGAIGLGRSSRGPMGNGMGATTVAAALRAAARDEDVAAILFRVDSPGGSYAASDTIRREVVLARQAGKPVVVSMGTVAGSGGYFVSMAADVIVASPGTLTGSIGVFGGKAVVDRLLDRAGIGTASVAQGEHALMFSARQPYTDSELELLHRWLDRVYDDFVGKVAADRGMTVPQTHEVARGRIWTGADAAERGLVDELGGLATAVQLARTRGGLRARQDLADVRNYPRVKPQDRLHAPRSSDDPGAASAALGWGPLGQLAARLGLPASGPLMMPDLLDPR
ncbi:MAG TPA: signal peptide peptidase SppA [Mycobacteriales bacterium]|jgi:protease-4|nr:signal peptide peptidase SppA [Mycobacteriales bacterium]